MNWGSLQESTAYWVWVWVIETQAHKTQDIRRIYESLRIACKESKNEQIDVIWTFWIGHQRIFLKHSRSKQKIRHHSQSS